MNPLKQLQSFGQSFWYDNIRRKYLLDGTIKRLITEDGLRGMTSNPSIFDQAIGQSDDYDAQIQELRLMSSGAKELYEKLAIKDIELACDLLRPVYESSQGLDGYVSLEVSPYLARDSSATVEEALRLSAEVDRPNLMVKVPSTKEGIPAVRELIGRGININITLMFSKAHYESVSDAYCAGLDDWIKRGGQPDRVSSVASFFVSRVDSAVDKLLAESGSPSAGELLGRTAVANSKVVYQRYKEIFFGDSFTKLKEAGARTQRLLWASTSTKNPAYPDTLYVNELIGPDTVNTMPPQTIDAFRDHGQVENTLESDIDEAAEVLRRIGSIGINLDEVTEQLQENGVAAFAKSFDQLIGTLERKLAST